MKNTKQTKCLTFSIELTTAQFNKLRSRDIEKLHTDVERLTLQAVTDSVGYENIKLPEDWGMINENDSSF